MSRSRHGVRSTAAAFVVSLALPLTAVVGTATAASPLVDPVVAFGVSDADSIPLLAGNYHVNAAMAGGLP